MSTKTLQTLHKGEGNDDIWAEAAKLFSEHYGVWGPDSGRAGMLAEGFASPMSR